MHVLCSPDGRVTVGGSDDVHHGLAGVACGHVPQHPRHVGATCPAVAVNQVHAAAGHTFTENKEIEW